MNDAATLRAQVQSALRDPAAATWSTGDIDSLVARAVASLYPRVARWVPADDATMAQTLVAGTYFYAVPGPLVNVSRIQLVTASGTEAGDLQPGTWRLTGDLIGGTAKAQVSPAVVDANPGATIRFEGYARHTPSGPYLIPDDCVQYVVAWSAAEAVRMTLADRARFKNWANSDQTLNVSVNEMLGMVAQFERSRDMERERLYTWRKPLPAR